MLPLGFIKMLMSGDFEDKVIQISIALLAVVIVCFAWWTTNINEQPHYRTVFLLDRRFRRRTNRSRLTTHIQSTSIVGGSSEEEATAAVGDNQVSESVQTSETNKPPEASTSTNTSSEGDNDDNVGHIEESPNNIEDEELATIVEIMDADANEVRLRRLAYYENQNHGSASSNGTASQATTSTEQSNSNQNNNSEETNSQPNVSNSSADSMEDNLEEHVEIIHEPIMEHNYAEREAVHINPTSKDQPDNSESATSAASPDIKDNGSNIRIKLKYLNDELKLVDGRLEEQLGDFKRRHFHPEFSSNKLVRLIFNGQVLQPDTETLQSCGLFDNCVVHCLVHQQRNTFNETNNSGTGFTSNARTGGIGLSQANNNNTQGRDWDLGNVLLIFVSIILGSAWYFKYEYAHLYTVTATVALVAITGIFTIFLVGFYFPDPVPAQPEGERRSMAT